MAMPAATSLVERAYELARSGAYKDKRTLMRELKREGYSQLDIEAHLQGRQLSREIMALIKAAESRTHRP